MTNPVDDLKHELLSAAERQQAVALREPRHAGAPRRRHLLLASAALGITAAVALTFLFSTGTAPSVIERAQAALTPPRGSIAHREWAVTTTSADFGCTVTRAPNEVWFDTRPPQRYRLVATAVQPAPSNSFDYQAYIRNLRPRNLACAKGRTLEIGGSLDPGAEETLVFKPPNRLIFMPWYSTINFPIDPAANLRAALRAGRAHDEGRTELDGRTVVRIRIDPPPTSRCPDCPRKAAYVYVDPETFYPVEEHVPGAIRLPDRPVVSLDVVVRYTTFEYLPRTRANLRLASIKAQHPGWTR